MPQTFTQYLAESGVNSNNWHKEVISEASLSRLWRKYKECDSGTISACRGNKTPKENKANTKKLMTELIQMGYSVTAIDGVYIENYGMPNAQEVKEKSFIVFDHNKSGRLKRDLITLGKKYEQDSITFNSVKDGNYYLIGTNETGYPGLGNQEILGKPMFGEDGTFHSKVKGRPFVFTLPKLPNKVNEDLNTFDLKLTDFNLSRIRTILSKPDYVIED